MVVGLSNTKITHRLDIINLIKKEKMLKHRYGQCPYRNHQTPYISSHTIAANLVSLIITMTLGQQCTY